MQEKSLLRRAMRARISEQSPLEREQASKQLCLRLAAWLDEQKWSCQRVAIFLAGPREPSLDEFARELQKHNVEVYAPHITEAGAPFTPIAADWSNVELNSAGWRQPQDRSGKASLTAGDMNLIFLPGLAFDLKGNRLGQGGGWYDRALQDLPPAVLCVGVGFDFQIVETLPHEPHDRKVSVIASDKRILSLWQNNRPNSTSKT